MAGKKLPLVSVTRVTLTSATQNISLLSVEPGWLYCIQRAAFVNETTAASKCVVYATFSGKNLRLKTLTTTAVNCPDVDADPFYLVENQVLGATMITAGVSDVVEIVLLGWKQRVGEMQISAES